MGLPFDAEARGKECANGVEERLHCETSVLREF